MPLADSSWHCGPPMLAALRKALQQRIAQPENKCAAHFLVCEPGTSAVRQSTFWIVRRPMSNSGVSRSASSALC